MKDIKKVPLSVVPCNFVGQETEDQIKAWKATHKNGIYAITVEGHIGYFKNPDRIDMNCAMSKADKDAALDVYDDLAESTFIGGSRALLEQDDMFFGVIQMLKAKMDGKKATLVNL